MARYIANRGRCVLQIEIADHLESHFGAAAVYTSPISGNRRIHRTVLDRFRRQYPDIEYNRHIDAWEAPETFTAPPEPLTLW